MSEIISIPLNKLVRSPRNVRKTGGESYEDLAASILAHGLLHNLTVIEQLNQKGAKSGKYEIIAGARRFAALECLASEKKISKTFAVPCKVIEASAALEASLAENTIRVAMHPTDQFVAFHGLVTSGLSVDEVAARFGVTTLFVRQPVNVSQELLEEAEKLQAELNAMQDDESVEYSEERVEQIEARLEQIEAVQTEFTAEQKAKSGVIFTISHNGEPNYHCGLVERSAKRSSQNGEESGSTSPEEEDGLSAALLEDLTIQRTAALRAELAARPDIALVAVTHNLAVQVFYDELYSLPTGLTIRTEAYTDRVDLRSAEESAATKSLAKLTKAIRKSLPAKVDDLWQWLLDQPQNVLLNVLAAAAAHTVNAVQRPHDEPSNGRLGGAKALARALEFNMTNWWQASAANYFGRIKKEQIFQAIEDATGAPVDERLKSLKKKDLAAEAEKCISSTRWLPEPLR